MKIIRDYDKEPIVIIDYGDLFQEFFGCCIVWLIFFYSEIIKILNGDFSRVFSDNILTIIKVDIVMPLSLFVFAVYYYYKVRKIYNGKFYFKFSNKSVFYRGYDHEQRIWSLVTKIIDITNIEKISFCILSELPNRYGRKMKSQPKKSTISNALAYLYYFLEYTLIIFPYKLFRFLKNNEPLNLLNKNIVIVFKNENYMLVNIYSQKDLDDLLLYFKSKNIQIEYKSVFIHHLQRISRRRTFINKYEDWCEEF